MFPDPALTVLVLFASLLTRRLIGSSGLAGKGNWQGSHPRDGTSPVAVTRQVSLNRSHATALVCHLSANGVDVQPQRQEGGTLLPFAHLKSGCFQSCIIGSTVQPGSPSILSMEARSWSQFARLEQQICAFGRMSNWPSSDPAGTTSKPISGWETGSADPQ